jgi:hypothetical protein
MTLDVAAPHAGDLVLARVDTIGYHWAQPQAAGRSCCGGQIVVAYGNRYAEPVRSGGQHWVRAISSLQGVAAKASSWHASISRATQITRSD